MNLIDFVKQMIQSDSFEVLGSSDLRVRRETIRSITKLLCVCDILTENLELQIENRILNDILSTFKSLLSKISLFRQ